MPIMAFRVIAFHIFETELGFAGIAWRDAGIVALAFPQAEVSRVRARFSKRNGNAAETTPPSEIAAVAAGVRKLLTGSPETFDDARLDMSAVSPFDRSVLDLTRRIAPGRTKTYGGLARELGDASLSRRVGQALARNPYPIVVPCHRVIGAGGRMTGFSAPGGAAVKEQLLKIEGALSPGLFD
jgi:methylated-DNA-[protein]-cysteine S-methyltransferase